MDFLNRNGQSAQPGRPVAPGAAPQHAPVPNHENMPEKAKQHYGFHHMPGWLRVANVVLLFSITILAVSIALMLHSSNPNESKYIATDKYQAVFLNNGQVYFGKVASLNAKSINLQSVFYLNSQSQSTDAKTTDAAANQFTLIKLGCELHGPYDQMIVNRDQVTFWENLKDDGQVVKTIKEWIKQNPNGQKCSTTTSNSTTQNGTSTQSATSTQNASTTTGTTNKTQ